MQPLPAPHLEGTPQPFSAPPNPLCWLTGRGVIGVNLAQSIRFVHLHVLSTAALFMGADPGI